MKKLLAVAIVGTILYKLIPYAIGLNGIDMLFIIGFLLLAGFACKLFFQTINAYTTFRR
jgi:hypothetical protein